MPLVLTCGIITGLCAGIFIGLMVVRCRSSFVESIWLEV
jgi:hypothetical protein